MGFNLEFKWLNDKRIDIYGMDSPGIESRWDVRFTAPVQTSPGAHPAYYTVGTGSFPEVKRPGRCVHHPPHLVSRLREE